MRTFTRNIVAVLILLGTSTGANAQCVPAPVPNDACYQQVIANDTYCCNTAWDFICQNAYDLCVPPPPVGCPVVAPVPDDGCYQSVIASNPNCCNIAWDVTCQDAYDNCTSVTFPCTGGTANFIVPPCITEVTILATGAQGGGAFGGLGAEVSGTVTVVPGQTLIVSTGCQGTQGNGSGGFGGGGNGLNSNAGISSFGGGGASYVSTAPGGMGNALAVAGGGGGTGGGDNPGEGGDGGCPNGGAGTTTFGFGGGGGTGAAGGIGGAPWTFGGGAGGNGTIGQGGNGGPDIAFGNNPGGGGGGGYYGGGGGGSDNISGTFGVGGGGGGAGSSLIPAGGNCNPGTNAGNGEVIIAYGCETTDPTGSNPNPINVQCAANVPAPNVNVVTDEADNCGAPAVAFVSDVSDGNTCPETITRTYSITDPCLNQILVTQTITVDDTQNPVLAAAPANITVDCGAIPPAVNLNWTDNCDGAGSVAPVDGPLTGGSCGGTITRTWTYTDACGNVATTNQIITVNDNVNPIFAAPPANVTVDCIGNVPAMTNLGYTDNCAAPGNVAGVDAALVGGTCGGTITRTWTFTDACGNIGTAQQIITVDDNVNPIFAAAPANITVDCIGNVPAMTNLGYTDNCDAPGNVPGVDAALVGGNCGGTITRTWTYTDACGNVGTAQQIITVDDNVAPVLTAAPANVNVECATDVPAMINLNWTDNCDGAGNVMGVDVSDGNTCPEVITRTWTYTDACGNVATQTQTITVQDVTNPVFAAPPVDITVECAGDVPAIVNLNWTDNCDGAGNVPGTDGAQVGTDCGGTITRTWTYTDACGNVATVSQVITIDDNTDPTATNPPDINVAGGVAPGPDITVVTDEADNCDPTPTVAWVSDVSDNASCPETITRTYSVTDDCGNTINVIQLVIIGDANPPTGTPPGPLAVQCAADVPPADPLLITDEADNSGVPVVTHLSDVSDGNTCPEIITRTYAIEDDCGNITNVIQLITINDTQAPVFAAPPANANVECAADVPAMTNLAYTDNCDPNGNVIGVDVSDGNTCPEIITRTWTFTDACGNVATESQTITVMDVTAPVFAAPPADVTVECATDVPAMTNLAYTDNCDPNGNVPGVDGALVGGTCGGTITRTWTFTDLCGNNATVTQTITVDDTTDPTATNPPNINTTGAVPGPDITVVSDEADNCDPTPTVAFISDVSDNGSCPETITRTYSVTDDCGNSINVIQLIIIGDPILPTATAPANEFELCLADVSLPDPNIITDEADNGGIPVVAWVSDVSDGNTCPETITRTYSVTDNCGNVIFVTHDIIVQDLLPPSGTAPGPANYQCIADVPPGNPGMLLSATDNCTVNPAVAYIGDVSDGNTCPETLLRSWTITDDCGNVTQVDQLITINDTQNPVATAPANVNVECITAVPAVNLADVTGVSDNCTVAPVVAHVSDVSDGNSCPETITRTYSITDDCLNQILVTQDIIINDVTDPTASNAAQTIVPGGPAPAPDPTVIIDEADNCGTPTVAFVSQVSDNNPCPESIIYTYSVTDSCGNSINVTHEVLITDPIAPTGTPPAAINVECIDLVPLPDATMILDEADNNGVPTVTHLSDVSDGNTCPEIITRTYRITDACANITDVIQLITVHDLTDPTASNPAGINVECIADVPAADITVVIDELDNCGTPIVAFVGDVSDNNTCPETITRTYSVTDSCGNSITVDQTIIVNDITAPTGTAPAAIVVECAADVPADDATLILDEADNCTANPTVVFLSDVSDGNTCPEIITRTYRITDDCGNTTDVTQSITVDDTTDPTASNPSDIVIPGGPAPAPDVTVVTDEADNCTAAPTVLFVSDVSDNNPCPETITRTYSITDDCNNQILVTQNVIITDPIDPTGTAPANVNVECIGDVPVEDVTLIVDEADNNGAPVVAFVSDVSDGNTCPEIITRTYSITDQCGNSINVQQLITVNDITDPTASNPLAINVECIGDVPGFDITVVTDESDNCTANPTVAFVSDVSDNNSCPETITRTYSVTDDCGNTINVTQAIIVNDITNPTASNPIAINVECIADVPVNDITVVTDEADNCTANPIVAFVSDVSDGNTCPEIITRTYSVTDDCGNSINVAQTITVNDVTDPTASNPVAVNVACASDLPAPNPAVVTDAADNCSVPVVAFVSDVTDGNTCNGETITRTYSVTDDCGNTINVTQAIIIDVVTPTVDAGMDQSVCEGTMVTVNAGNPNGGIISWDGGVIDGVAFNSPVGTTTYTVTTELCGGECLATDQMDVTVNPLPIVAFEGDDLFGCEPHVVTFTNLSTDQGNCVWDFGDGNSVNNCGPVSNTYDGEGEYDVTLTVTSNEGCTSSTTYTDYVAVAPFPVAAFTYAPQEIDILDTEVNFTNESLNADTYTWNFGDFSSESNETDPAHIFPETGDKYYTVSLIAESNAGCVDQTTVVIYIKDELLFFVPNIFTPDGNTVNNTFFPVFTSGFDFYDYHMTVFNRWGEIVFETYNSQVGWDGHFGDGGLCDDGVYVWQIEFGETGSDKRQKHRGHVTVLK
jgi:gliding motility-associated-like protein